MFTPRNTLVVVELLENKEKTLGGIVIPNNQELYSEGIIAAVGPGNVNAAGARAETHDLHVGQRVLVKRYEVRQSAQSFAKSEAGIRYTYDGKNYMIFEQTSIIVILELSPFEVTMEARREARLDRLAGYKPDPEDAETPVTPYSPEIRSPR